MADEDEKSGGLLKVLALLVALGAGVAALLKKKRDQELDEALWEEPRGL